MAQIFSNYRGDEKTQKEKWRIRKKNNGWNQLLK